MIHHRPFDLNEASEVSEANFRSQMTSIWPQKPYRSTLKISTNEHFHQFKVLFKTVNIGHNFCGWRAKWGDHSIHWYNSPPSHSPANLYFENWSECCKTKCFKILVEFSNGIQLFDKGHFVRLVTLVTHDSRNVIKVKFPISFWFFTTFLHVFPLVFD